MPIENEKHCDKCWRPNYIAPVVSSVIILYNKGYQGLLEDNYKTWKNLCNQHQISLDKWFGISRAKFERGTIGNKIGLDKFQFEIPNESNKFPDIRREVRKQYLDGEYKGKYSG